MYKRTIGARPVWLKDVPTYIAELDELEDIYFGRKQLKDEKERAKLRGLYEYCWNLKPPATPSLHVPHNLLVYLAKVAPKEREKEFILEKLAGYGYKIDNGDLRFQTRLESAILWAREIETFTSPAITVTGPERDAVLDLATIVIANGEEAYLQNSIFTLAKKHGLPPGQFFKALYRILIGSDSGPRLGPYILAMGRENVATALVRAAKTKDV